MAMLSAEVKTMTACLSAATNQEIVTKYKNAQYLMTLNSVKRISGFALAILDLLL